MRNNKKLLLEQLEQKLAAFKFAKTAVIPQKGWVNTIRTTLNMTREQLGVKTNMTKGAIQKIEEREAEGQITINKLKKVAEGLDMQLVYGFVPKKGSLDQLIDFKAEKLARKIVLRTNQTMKLEDQGIEYNKIESSIDELAAELKRELKKSLWD